MGKERVDALGKSLIRDKNRRQKGKNNNTSRHTVDKNDGYEWNRLNLSSVTEQNHLDEFLEIAELAGAEFTAEKQNVSFVTPQQLKPVTKEEEEEITKLQKEHVQLLQIPRKPIWSRSMSAEELQQKEKDSFLEWRQQLAKLEQIDGLILTPFEKNLEFWRQLWRVIEKSDVVIQIVDARNPLLFFCEDLNNYVKEVDPNKKNAILLNKSDLLKPEQRMEWVDYFKNLDIPAAVYSALQADELEEQNSSSLAEAEKNSSLLSRQELLDFFRSLFTDEAEKKEVLTVGFVGYPNVGKSSTINSLYKLKKTSVSATPGKTKHYQTLFVEDDLCLCDCPGLVMPSFVLTKAELIVNGILPIDQMQDHIGAINILSQIPRHILQKTYGIILPKPDSPDEVPNVEELLNAYGYVRGFMTQRGLPDHSRTARYILKDYVKGKLLYCHAPPGKSQELFHQFPPPTDDDSAVQLTPQSSKFYTNLAQDLDRAFFKQVRVQAHVKGINTLGTRPAVSEAASSEKPWKKHHNRNKREKLRRVYADLDQ